MSVSGAHLQTLEIAGRAIARWELWRKLRQQAKEQGRKPSDPAGFAIGELWEEEDEKAFDAWEQHVLRLTGQVPLPLELAPALPEDIHPSDLEGLECAS